MSTDEYVPSEDDDRIAHAYAEVVHLGSEGMVSHNEAVEEFYAYLAAHDARVHRDAAREALDGLAAHFDRMGEGADLSDRWAWEWHAEDETREYANTHYTTPEETP